MTIIGCLLIVRRTKVLAFAFFAAIFSSLCWLIYALAYVSDNIVGISFSSLGIVDISVYTAFVIFPVFLLWMVFGYINQHINNQKTAKALYQLFMQMKKNQDYTDLVARIMLESEQQIKDGFILSRIDILISDMNELIAEIINRAALASREQIESLWSRVRNGGKWALGKVIIEINQNQPNFQMRLFDKAQNDTVLSGSILEFCARYQNILALLSKHDAERVFLSVIETGVFGKVFTILAPLADEIRKFRENAYYNQPEANISFNKPKTTAKAAAQPQKPAYAPQIHNTPASAEETREENKPSIINLGISKISSFLKKDKKADAPSNFERKDPFSIALERSFGSASDENESTYSESVDFEISPAGMSSQPQNNDEVISDIILSAPQDENPQDIVLAAPHEEVPGFDDIKLDVAPEPVAVPITNTQKTLNNLKKEWADMKKNTLDETPEPKMPASQEKKISGDDMIYPFGGWTDENNYK